VYPIVEQQTLETEWAKVRDQCASAASLSLVYLVIAIGCLNDHNGVSSEVERLTQSQAFHRQSWKLLGYILDRPYMSSVQVIILHVYQAVSFVTDDRSQSHTGYIPFTPEQERYLLGALRAGSPSSSIPRLAQAPN
jgi:hypothetical protein